MQFLIISSLSDKLLSETLLQNSDILFFTHSACIFEKLRNFDYLEMLVIFIKITLILIFMTLF